MNGNIGALGPAGRLAQAFIHSKLTPLVILTAVGLGAMAIDRLPREEEPQIVVPMVDVFVRMPGASAKEVEERVTKPMERLLSEIPGVEYVYSTSSSGQSVVIVRFLVGQDEERSLVRLKDKLSAHADLLPSGASPPLVKPRSIDDVPVLALTLSSPRYGGFQLRLVAKELEQAIKQVPDVSEVTVIGSERRQVRVVLDPARLAGRGLSAVAVADALLAANQRLASGAFARDNREILLETGAVLQNADDVRRVVVGATAGHAVFLGDVAVVLDGPEEPATYVTFGTGAAARGESAPGGQGVARPAVTLSIAKRKGVNAVDLVQAVQRKVAALQGTVIPSDVRVETTRDYGATARSKSDELLLHMAIAVFSVALLIWLTLGWREAGIVLLTIPATLALTLTVFYLYGYTLNRITLFALIFSIGILVDDAIVVLENISRHRGLPENRGRSLADIAVGAVAEVGNPTILATMTVVAAILPMAFVGGLMGPYMRPIPVGATAAMVFSLLVAFVVTPWATVRLLGRWPARNVAGGAGEHGARESATTRLYRRFMTGLLSSPGKRWLFLGSVVALLLGSMALVATGWVKVKMLPFDNKSEVQVIVDMPEGTTLEQTARVTDALTRAVARQPEVTNYQSYVGTSGPFNFNGLVRHYYLRQGSNVADVQVNLVDKGERQIQSHAIAKRIRDELAPLATRFGVRIKVAEVPPGPPVLETLVAEVYGTDYERQIAIARDLRGRMERLPGVVDVDWYVEDPQPKYRLLVDVEKAALAGVRQDALVRTLRMVTAGESVGLLHDERANEDVPIVLRADRATRSDLDRLRGLRVEGRGGVLVSVGELIRAEPIVEDRSIYHKNLMPVVYVTADVAGVIESPVYAITKLGKQLDEHLLEEGYRLEQHTASQPSSTERYSMKWDGEWHITYEVFRDLGLAFAVVLVLIYVLVVAWFQSFSTPLIIMSVIPISLVGILPAHGLLGAFFSATSMIGFIAGAGIVVRNSIILVDFIELRRAQGMELRDAVVDAGAVRFRPMVLTAAAVVLGAGVILFDPIFQGLAISLMAGELASLVLSRITVPVVYYLAHARQRKLPSARRAVAEIALARASGAAAPSAS